MIDIAAGLKSAYKDLNKRKKAVRAFRIALYDEIDSISRWCLPKLNFERLLCALLVYADCIEGVLYRAMKQVWKKKKKDYEKMKCKNISNILDELDKYLPDHYTFNQKTLIIIYDSIEKKSSTMTLDRKQVKYINSLEYKKRKWLFKIYLQTKFFP